MRRLLCVVLVLGGLAGCRPSLLEQALSGKLPPEESNAIITEYCQSCHIHRAFDPSGHAERMQAFYDRPPYNVATACRACHLVQEDTWGVKRRKTLWPAQVAAQAAR